RILLRLNFFVAIIEVDADTGVHQEDAEDIQDFMELFNEIGSDKNEYAPKNDRPEDTPEKDFVVVRLVHLEILQDEQDHEDVIHRQRVLGQVSREVLVRAFGAALIIYEDKYAEQRGNHHPEDRLIECRTGTDLACLLVEQAQVEHQEQHDDDRENPE